MIASQDVFRQLAACSKDLFFVYDFRNNSFSFLSDTIARFLDISTNEIKQKPEVLLSFLQEEDKEYLLKEFKTLQEGNICIDVEFRLCMPDQRIKWVHLKAYLLQEPGHYHIAGIATEITQRKEYDLSVWAIKEQKDITLQILGHDLRSPLNTITQIIQLLEREIQGEAKGKAKQFLDIIGTICRNSLNLIGEVLNVEFIETQQMGIKLQRLDIISRIQLQLDTYQLARNSDKKFYLYPRDGVLYFITDPIRFQLIIENLLSNAYKFTKHDGEITVRVEEKEKVVMISVADNGIGIPEQFKPMVFDKFTKARRAGQQGEKPVGLGMHLVRTMVEQLKGHIWLESQEGKGTTFFVELPKEL